EALSPTVTATSFGCWVMVAGEAPALRTMLSMAHHQSLAASCISKEMTTFVAPAGLFSWRSTDSFWLSGWNVGLPATESHFRIRAGAPPLKLAVMIAVWLFVAFGLAGSV